MKFKSGDIISACISVSDTLKKFIPSDNTASFLNLKPTVLTIYEVKEYKGAKAQGLILKTIEQGEIIILTFSGYKKLA
jgi:hypothetical protein